MRKVLTYQELEERNAYLEGIIMQLQEQLDWLKKQNFETKSEQLVTEEDQMEFPGREITEDAAEDKFTFPKDLPKEIILLDLPEAERVCPQTGDSLEKIGEEVTQKLAFKSGTFFIKEFIRPKYVSKNAPEMGVITSPSQE